MWYCLNLSNSESIVEVRENPPCGLTLNQIANTQQNRAIERKLRLGIGEVEEGFVGPIVQNL